ncbi:hypothetical protein KI387_006181, partial [Taxus chinensis]
LLTYNQHYYGIIVYLFCSILQSAQCDPPSILHKSVGVRPSIMHGFPVKLPGPYCYPILHPLQIGLLDKSGLRQSDGALEKKLAKQRRDSEYTVDGSGFWRTRGIVPPDGRFPTFWFRPMNEGRGDETVLQRMQSDGVLEKKLAKQVPRISLRAALKEFGQVDSALQVLWVWAEQKELFCRDLSSPHGHLNHNEGIQSALRTNRVFGELEEQFPRIDSSPHFGELRGLDINVLWALQNMIKCERRPFGTPSGNLPH